VETRRRGSVRSAKTTLGVLLLFGLAALLRLGSWRTYSDHHFHRHYIWEATLSEVLLRVVLPVVAISVIVMVLVWRARRTRQATGRGSSGMP